MRTIQVPDDFDTVSPGPSKNGRLKFDFEFLAKIVGYVAGALLLWSAMNARVSVLEAGFQQMRDDVKEIKQDVKALRR